jgi:hypothetical protein
VTENEFSVACRPVPGTWDPEGSPKTFYETPP